MLESYGGGEYLALTGILREALIVTLDDALADTRANRGMFYVYVMRRPNGEPFYVGKGCRRRIASHERDALNGVDGLRHRYIKKIWRSGSLVDYDIIGYYATEMEAFAEETALIARLGRRKLGSGPLINLTDGGEGPTGAKHSAATRKKLSDRNFDGEWKAKAIAALLAPETKALQREAEPRRLIAVAAAQRKPEARAKRSLQMATFLAEHPQEAERRRQQLKAFHNDPEMLARFAEGTKRTWEDPDVRARRSAGINAAYAQPGAIERKRADSTKRWQNASPEERERHRESCRSAALRRYANEREKKEGLATSEN